MSQYYSDPSRESDPHALPDIEVFWADDLEDPYGEDYPAGDASYLPAGWYWWPCFPGCLPDGEPAGPFESEAEAVADMRDNYET